MSENVSREWSRTLLSNQVSSYNLQLLIFWTARSDIRAIRASLAVSFREIGQGLRTVESEHQS